MNCFVCHEALGGTGTIGSYNCGHCLHTTCHVRLRQFHSQPGTARLRCPLCATEVTTFTRLFLDPTAYSAGIHASIGGGEMRHRQSTGFSLYVEGAGFGFLDGKYDVVTDPPDIPLYHKVDALSCANKIRIHQKVGSNGILYWYICAEYDDYESEVDYYSAPVHIGYHFIPPSRGWIFVGESDSPDAITPPFIYHMIE